MFSSESLITLTTATTMQLDKYGNFLKKFQLNSMLVAFDIISDLFLVFPWLGAVN